MSLPACLFAALLLLPALLLQTGCGCIKTVASVRASDEMRRKMQKELEAREEAEAKATLPSPGAPGASAFDTETRLESMRDAFTAGRWDEVRHDGLALVTAALDEVTKLEVLSMLADAFQKTGDRSRAADFDQQFRRLYEELRKSDKLAKEGRERTTLMNTLAKLKRKMPQQDMFATPDGEQRTSFKLAEKLRSGGTDEVLTEQLGDGGTVYFSRSAEALEGKVPRELAAVIQKDPEFDYYFAIEDAPRRPPAPAHRENECDSAPRRQPGVVRTRRGDESSGLTTGKLHSTMMHFKRSREGVLLYFALGLMLVLAILGGVVWMLGRYESYSADQVRRSEALTAMGEAVLEEAFLQITQQLNAPKADNKIYSDVREPKTDDIKIDNDYLEKITPNSRKMIKEQFDIADPKKDVVLHGKITNIEPFDVKGFTDASVKDPIEKHASLELEVFVRWEGTSETVAISRPFKVVKVVMPVFSETTLFLNNGEPKLFAQWPSVYGYDPARYPAEQFSLELDNGWHGYAKSHKKSDFIKRFEEDVLTKGAVPPGRVFIAKGIVPLTNGDRASGALQKTFHSGESELLPTEAQFPLKTIKEQLTKYGFQPSPEPTNNNTQTSTTGNTSGSAASPAPSASPGASPDPNPTASPGTPADAVPGSGELFVRYVGSGEELKSENVKLGGKSMDSYAPYHYSLIKGPWSQDKKLDPALSGLDLMGRVVEKKKGSSFEGEGFFGKIFGFIKKITSDLLNKLYSQYDIRISPTLVYGECVLTYYRVLDYVETGWLDKMKNTLSFNPNQFPLPVFADDYLNSRSEHQPLARKEDLPGDWPDEFKEKFLKMPEDIRKPKFFKILQKTIFAQDSMGLSNDFLARIPPGATFSSYNEALINYLTPDPQSRLRSFFAEMAQRGTPFLKNEVDRQLGNPGGPFKDKFALPLPDFNPFLFYVKATDYISSLWDPRDPRRYLFYEKYWNKKENCFDINGVIYITGTEDLVLGGTGTDAQMYRGKAIIITFGRVVFKGAFIKHKDADKPDDRAANANLTIVSLGGVVFDTSERVDAMVYSYIYPPQASEGKSIYVYGALGANNLELDKIGSGGRIVFDYTYHLPKDMPAKDRLPYYHVAITNEISRYGYSIRRDDNGLPTDNQ